MKKIIAIVASLVLITASFAGCTGGDPLNPATEPTTEETTATVETKAEKKVEYKDTFSDLRKYLQDEDYIELKNKTELQASLINADKGYRYSFKYNGSNVYVELYVAKSDEGKKYFKEVKEKGYFEVLEKTEAYVSDNGKYLMVYDDKSDDEKNIKHKKQTVKAFKKFGS
ncbi:MAG: hypothetical protein ACI4QE_03775 [Acutalibacteraceae bacterium]